MRLLRVASAIVVLCLTASAQVREKETPQTREQQVRDVLEKFNSAYQEKNSEALAKLATSELSAFAAGNAFTSWNQFHDNFLAKVFSRQMPPSTWEVQKVVTVPEMAWAYTRTTYKARRQGQPIEADLYQVFVLQSTKVSAASQSPSSSGDWKIVLIDYNFHREPLSPQLQPDAPGASHQ